MSIFYPSTDSTIESYRNFTPEQRLWLEVIFRAYHDYVHFFETGCICYDKYREAKNARSWIFSNKNTVQSFRWCCEQSFDSPVYAITYIRKECIKKPQYTPPPPPPIDASLTSKDSGTFLKHQKHAHNKSIASCLIDMEALREFDLAD